ncbi:unnamed protein product [Clonostachys rosea f. rosea IK726]|uniref:Uncharacterized protein n=1 Tax=Clonostachys rosea f. rosea IK726 TaxID=1349383 RepID=A0ACA9UMN3_BIOOC|nr:unnamed protein product [Clonostachys rosea f. rosea IK726]
MENDPESLTAPVPPPPSPNIEVSLADNAPRAGQIFCEKSINQTVERIHWDVDDLLARSPDKEEWQCYLVPVNQWEGSSWTRIKHLPLIHVVRKTPDDEFFVVALADSCIQHIRKYGVRLKLVPEADVEYHGDEFSTADFITYGIREARQKYRRQFIRNAGRGINSRCGRGLGRLYQRTTLDEGMQTAIHWAILITDILELDAETCHRFLVSVRFLCLHIEGNLSNLSATASIEKKPDTWHKLFQQLYTIKTVEPAEDPKAEMHQVSLLRGLCEFAGGATDDLQHAFNTKLSTNDNMAILGDLFQLDFVKPLMIGSLWSGEVMDVLLRQQQLQVTRQMLDWLQGMHVYVPLGYSPRLYQALPADFAHALEYRRVKDVEALFSAVFYYERLLDTIAQGAKSKSREAHCYGWCTHSGVSGTAIQLLNGFSVI